MGSHVENLGISDMTINMKDLDWGPSKYCPWHEHQMWADHPSPASYSSSQEANPSEQHESISLMGGNQFIELRMGLFMVPGLCFYPCSGAIKSAY